MTDRDSFKVSEFTWYSRLAAWIGAAMLLAQSVLGRDAGPITLLAVLLLGFGFLCFLIGLAVDSRVPGTGLLTGPRASDRTGNSLPPRAPAAPVHPTAPHQTVNPAGVQASDATIPRRTTAETGSRAKAQTSADLGAETSDAVPPSSGRRPKFRERAKKSDVRLDRSPANEQPKTTQPEASSRQGEVPSARSATAVATELLASGHNVVGTQCACCDRALRGGELAATCPVCCRTQHATCWMENHFHCAVPDCTGHGSLEAPVDSAQAGQAAHE